MACSIGRSAAGLLKNYGVPTYRGLNSTLLRHCSIAHTLKVRDNINKKREEAMLGGGKKRIDAQHKKVGISFKEMHSFCCYFNLFYCFFLSP